MEALEEVDDVRAWTTVHSRYHVLGCIDGESELIEAVQRRRDAFKLAAKSIGPRQYQKCSVFDSMARLDQPEEWTVDADGTTCIVKRRTGRSTPKGP